MGKSKIPFPKLHVFLGAGGVGKTTLSAGYALHLAQSGKKVGLLSIDPARRLQTALGLDLSEAGQIPVEGGGRLHASFLNIPESMARWTCEASLDERQAQKLQSNPFYLALSERLASATDTLAAIRMAEWWEQFPDLDDLVVDTAPGLHAIDFLSKPDRLTAFLDSKLVEWLTWMVGSGDKKSLSTVQKILKSSAMKILDGLSQVGGQGFLLNFGEFLLLMDPVFVRARTRLSVAAEWLRSPAARLILVTALREDAVAVARSLGQEARALGMMPAMAVINRAPALPLQDPRTLSTLCQDLRSLQNPEAGIFAEYLTALHERLQNVVGSDLRSAVKSVRILPIQSGLESTGTLRLDDLARLGASLGNEA